ncbi:MAG TPA: DUF4350 domain-containing protein [Prolixibacteraceae bacterium]|nr:DUF4350 domain-containing protein [Prolixibacteraceae bacterium]
MKRNKLAFLIGILLLFVTAIALKYFSPKPVDWTVSYNINGKAPYSCYVLNDMLPIIFPQQSVEYNDESFYLALDSNSVEKKNLIVVTTDFTPDKLDMDALLNFVANGNNLFISSTGFGHGFLEKFKMEVESSLIDTSAFRKGKDKLFLSAPELKNDSGYQYTRKMPLVHISAVDTLNSMVLGTDRLGKVNFISTTHGAGKVYIHTQPMVFTNYHLLYGNTAYASKVLSYLPVQKTVWDSYYKPDRLINTSPMRYILSQVSLQSAYYLLLLTLLLYLMVESKRRQRVIPIVKPLENRSLEFVKTVGGLYFKQRNNADMARKKSIFFKEFLRERYFITNVSATRGCIELVSVKSGVDAGLVKQILKAADYYETSQVTTEGGLIELNRKIEMFYEQCF